jgi:histidyl-tRNA synthetase
MLTQPLKGFRDFLPDEARKRQYVISTLKNVFESYGFEPLETPALEYEEVLLGKYGEEGDKLLYRFIDNGERRVALRYDQTVPLSRVVAHYANELSFPFKRYQIQPVWRAENTQKGRFREFLQCDIDTVGTKSLSADAEIISVVAKGLSTLGFSDITISVNDRRNFEGIPSEVIISIDKLKKIGDEKVKAEIQAKGYDPKLLDTVKDMQPTDSLRMIMEYAKMFGTTNATIKFDPTLARGLNYYTGLIFEVEIAGYTAGSVAGGGRYDELIGMFTGNDVPAVGVAFGFDRIIEAMNERNLFPDNLIATKVLVTIFSPELNEESLLVGSLLRDNGFAVQVWLDSATPLEKQLKYANQKKIPYTILIGPDEAAKKSATVRNMVTREQKTMPIDRLPDAII